MMQDSEELFLKKAKAILESGAEELDGSTQQKLYAMRRRVLNSAPSRRPGFSFSLRWATLGGIAAAATAVLAVFFWLETSPGDFPAGHIEDFEILTSRERVDFYQNLEFYRWLAVQNQGVPDRKAS